jgi:hypothetical protein
MKKIIFTIAILTSITFASCSSNNGTVDDDSNCKECEISEVSDDGMIIGTTTSSVYCDNGNGTWTLTKDGESETFEFEEGISFEQLIIDLENTGATCE